MDVGGLMWNKIEDRGFLILIKDFVENVNEKC